MSALIEKLAPRRKIAAKGADDARKAINEVRALSARLRDERKQIEARPLPLEQAQDAAARAVLSEAQRVMDDLNLAGLMRPDGRRNPFITLDPDRRGALTFVAQAESVAAVISAALAERYQAQGLQGIDADDRSAELARIDADLLACEMAEEGIIRTMEAGGAAPLRRPDADPRALLAADAEFR